MSYIQHKRKCHQRYSLGGECEGLEVGNNPKLFEEPFMALDGLCVNLEDGNRLQ